MSKSLEATNQDSPSEFQADGQEISGTTTASDGPLVSIVTPVYNGERYLAECIESVLTQTYQNWEYVIVNNCSKDRTLEIAQSYARRDPRIRVHDCTEFLPLAENWNRALRLMSPESKYCKVVHADDKLMPNCVAAMVELAEAHPEVGLVSCLRRTVHGTTEGDVRPAGLPFSESVVPGDYACRLYFERRRNYLGAPSGVMIRSDLVRELDPLHNEITHPLIDLEAWLVVLGRSSLGFVHEVLTVSRKHEGSQSVSFFVRVKAVNLSQLYLLLRYGPLYLEPADFRRRFFRRFIGYHSVLLRTLLKRDWETWRYQRQQARLLGVPTGATALVRAGLARWLGLGEGPRYLGEARGNEPIREATAAR